MLWFVCTNARYMRQTRDWEQTDRLSISGTHSAMTHVPRSATKGNEIQRRWAVLNRKLLLLKDGQLWSICQTNETLVRVCVCDLILTYEEPVCVWYMVVRGNPRTYYTEAHAVDNVQRNEWAFKWKANKQVAYVAKSGWVVCLGNDHLFLMTQRCCRVEVGGDDRSHLMAESGEISRMNGMKRRIDLKNWLLE